MKTRPSIRKPSFFWQGALILLPALILCGIGLFSLRDDRLAAEHEARAAAARIAAELASKWLDALPPPAGPSIPQKLNRADDDPAWSAARRFGVHHTMLLSGTGELIYPPPFRALPEPAPLDAAVLSDSQRALWPAIPSGAASSEAVAEFLDSSPPPEFAAMARLSLAELSRANGDWETARPRFDSLLRESPELRLESGLPLAVLARWRLLGHALENRDWAGASNHAREIASYALLNPTPLSELLLGQLDNALGDAHTPPALASAIAELRRLWLLHERARVLAASHSIPLASDRFHWTDNTLWIAATSSHGYWVFRLPEKIVADTLNELIQHAALPGTFGVHAALAGRDFGDRPAPDRVLARQTFPSSDLGSVTVFLANPGLFHRQLRLHSLQLGALIVFAALTVTAGFLLAWRAQHRQHILNELKTNFVSSVSHELRAPIASVRLMAEELQDTAVLDRRRSKEYHAFIVQECSRLSALIENVLDFTRQEQGRRQYDLKPTDIPQLLRDTATLLESSAKIPPPRIELRLPPETRPVYADVRALQQVLLNLLDNAIKHSPQDAPIELGAAFPPNGDRNSSNGHARIWVRDQGPGIPESEHTRIFEQFYRRGSELRRETQGVGLGLAIVKQIVNAHGGRVLVVSQPGHGCQFIVELPIAPHR